MNVTLAMIYEARIKELETALAAAQKENLELLTQLAEALAQIDKLSFKPQVYAPPPKKMRPVVGINTETDLGLQQ